MIVPGIPIQFEILGIISATAVIVPGVVILLLMRGVRIKSFRTLTILLAAFAILHGLYHIAFILGAPDIGWPIDLATVVILIMMGLYYGQKTTAGLLAILAFPTIAADLVPIGLVALLLIFANLAIRVRSIHSLQTQLSIFIMIWAVAEILGSLVTLNIIQASIQLQLIGFEIHTAAMIAFGFFILFRFYRVTHVPVKKNLVAPEARQK